jgi:hypothetical protein
MNPFLLFRRKPESNAFTKRHKGTKIFEKHLFSVPSAFSVLKYSPSPDLSPLTGLIPPHRTYSPSQDLFPLTLTLSPWGRGDIWVKSCPRGGEGF